MVQQSPRSKFLSNGRGEGASILFAYPRLVSISNGALNLSRIRAVSGRDSFEVEGQTELRAFLERELPSSLGYTTGPTMAIAVPLIGRMCVLLSCATPAFSSVGASQHSSLESPTT